MASIWIKLKNIFKGNNDSRKCEQKEDGKWYCCTRVQGGRWEECIPAIAYDSEQECMENKNC